MDPLHVNTEPTVGDEVAAEMDEIEPVQVKVTKETAAERKVLPAEAETTQKSGADRSIRATGVDTAVAYRVTVGHDPIPVLVIPNSSSKNQSDWRLGAQVSTF